MNPDNPNFRKREWVRVRTLWPKRCSYTDKFIPMGSMCYHLYEGRSATGVVSMIETDQWIHDDEYLFLKLGDKL